MMRSTSEILGNGILYHPPRMYLGYCRCCGAVVRAHRMIDTDECADCLEWSYRFARSSAND